MRLVAAELLKIRRRAATWVVLLVLLGFMALVLVGTSLLGGIEGRISFPAAYGVIGEFALGLGGLIAIAYTAAIVGADWNWGVVRNVVARGESRVSYLLAKAAALAIILGIGLVIVFVAGIVFAYLASFVHRMPIENPFSVRGIQDFIEWLVLSYPVLLQRAAIGFFIAVVLRSPLAGAIVGIVLYIGEAIVTSFLTLAALAGMTFGGIATGEFEPVGPEWFQHLPISIGGNVLLAAPRDAPTLSGGLQQFILKPVPLEVALPLVLLYLAAALAVAIFAFRRQQIV